MWLVLCGSSDLPALWAYQGLRTRGLSPIELVSTDLLLYNHRCSHRIGADGVHVEITLTDGREIDNDTTTGVLNRLLSIAPDDLITAHADDRNYAAQEQFAFFLSWLTALGTPILNPPTPQGLSGQWRHRAEWIWLAVQAGLPVHPYRQSSRALAANPDADQPYALDALAHGNIETILVIGTHVVGDAVSPDLIDGCRKLARLAQTPLLGVEFVKEQSGARRFFNATPWPDLRIGGERALDALASALRGDRGSTR